MEERVVNGAEAEFEAMVELFWRERAAAREEFTRSPGVVEDEDGEGVGTRVRHHGFLFATTIIKRFAALEGDRLTSRS